MKKSEKYFEKVLLFKKYTLYLYLKTNRHYKQLNKTITMTTNNSANNGSFSKSEVISICNNKRFSTSEPNVSNLVILAKRMAEKFNGGYFTIRKSNYETGDSKVLAVIKHRWIPEIDSAGYVLIDYSNGGVEYIIGKTIGEEGWKLIINNYWFGGKLGGLLGSQRRKKMTEEKLNSYYGLCDLEERTDIIKRLYKYGEDCGWAASENIVCIENKTAENIVKNGGFTDGYYLGDDFASSVLEDSWSEEREDILWDWVDDCFYAGYKEGVRKYFVELGNYNVEVYEGYYKTIVKVA